MTVRNLLLKIFPLFVALLFLDHSLLAQNEITSIVTASDYGDFLNAHAVTDKYHFYNEAISSDHDKGCILRLGTPGNYQYEVIAGRENIPVTYVPPLAQKYYEAWIKSGKQAGASPIVSLNDEAKDSCLACNRFDFSITTSVSALSSLSDGTFTHNLNVEISPTEIISGFVLAVVVGAIGHDQFFGSQRISTAARSCWRSDDAISEHSSLVENDYGSLLRLSQRTDEANNNHLSEKTLMSVAPVGKSVSNKEKIQLTTASNLHQQLQVHFLKITDIRERFLAKGVNSSAYEQVAGNKLPGSYNFASGLKSLDNSIDTTLKGISSLVEFKKAIFNIRCLVESDQVFTSAEQLIKRLNNDMHDPSLGFFTQFAKQIEENDRFKNKPDEESQALAEKIEENTGQVLLKQSELDRQPFLPVREKQNIYAYVAAHEAKTKTIAELNQQIATDTKALEKRKYFLEEQQKKINFVEREKLGMLEKIFESHRQAVELLEQASMNLKVAEEEYVTQFSQRISVTSRGRDKVLTHNKSVINTLGKCLENFAIAKEGYAKVLSDSKEAVLELIGSDLSQSNQYADSTSASLLFSHQESKKDILSTRESLALSAANHTEQSIPPVLETDKEIKQQAPILEFQPQLQEEYIQDDNGLWYHNETGDCVDHDDLPFIDWKKKKYST